MHIYQRLTRRFGDHRSVTYIYSAINVFWLFPVAVLCIHKSQFALAWAVLAYLTLIVLAVLLDDGRPNTQSYA